LSGIWNVARKASVRAKNLRIKQIAPIALTGLVLLALADSGLAQTKDMPPSVPAILPPDLSPWGMFLQADFVVKTVIIGLFFASLVTWTIWLAKGIELVAAKRREGAATDAVRNAKTLQEASSAKNVGNSVVGNLVKTAQDEVDRSAGLSAEGIKERASVALSRIEIRAGRSMTRGTGLLATIGATAPFVGLFGTVWGIMNSFVGIAQTKTTNLAVVAPGIAEALLATAIGLFAAIPAVIIYNVFARAIAGYRAQLADASAEILQHLSRDLEGGKAATKRGRD
jgi:biopolymer transport protein ExbB